MSSEVVRVLHAKEKDEEGFWLIPCPKVEDAPVPVYNCAGSFVQSKYVCNSVRWVSVGIDGATVRCLWPEEREEEE